MKFLLIAMAIILSLVSLTFSESSYSEQYPQSQCGIDSLYVCLQYLGIASSRDNLYKTITPDENNHTNLYQLATVARTYNLKVAAFKTPTISDVLSNLTTKSCIILQWNETIMGIERAHIMPLILIPQKGMMVLDFPKAKQVSNEELSTVLTASKAMLVISPKNTVTIFFEKYLKWPALSVVCILVVYFMVFVIKKDKKTEQR